MSKKIRQLSEKPWTNTIKTHSQKKEMIEIVKDVDEDENYRTELVPLLRATVNLTCGNFELICTDDGCKFDKILMKDISIIKAPVSRGLTELPKVDHIWIAIDKGWKSRLNLLGKHRLWCRGYFYEYVNSHGKRNIGFQALSVKSK